MPEQPQCLFCGSTITRKNHKRDSRKYCDKACYFAAVRSGKQRFKGRVRDAWAAFVDWACDWEYRRTHVIKSRLELPACLICSKPTESREHKFCSRTCMYQWRGDRPCCLCGVITPNAQAHSSVVCRACKKKKAKARRPQHRSNFRRRARKYGVAYVPIKRIDIYQRDSWRCQLCHRMCSKTWLVSKCNGRPHPRSPTIDHIVPMSRGGGHVPENVQLACWSCNVAKGARRIGQLRLWLWFEHPKGG
jgi:5-methylcytosine-specific restriction endonuclease McrA